MTKVPDEKSLAKRNVVQWTIVAIAIIGALLTVAFTTVTKQIPLPPIATGIILATFYWRLVAGIVSVYHGYRSRIAKLTAKRAASVGKLQASASEKSE